MADFTVETANGVVTSYSGVEARHDLNAQSGVLVGLGREGQTLEVLPRAHCVLGECVVPGGAGALELGLAGGMRGR